MQSFEQLLDKVVSGTLTDSDKLELRRVAKEIDSVRALSESWVKAGSLTPTFINPTINNPRWQGSPLQAAFALRLADLTIPNTTNTYVTFDSNKNFGTLWAVDGAKVSWKGSDERAFQINGYANWAANATGYRGLWIEGFSAADVSLGTSPIHTFAGQNLVDNVLPVSFSFYFNGFSYVKFYVHQSSGGDLILKDLVLGLSLV